MAAHALTFLKDISEHSYTLETVKFALGHCQAGDQLQYDDWTALYNATSDSNVQEIATSFIQKYAGIHCFLKFPATAEAWSKEHLRIKGKQYHAFCELLWAKVAV